MTARKARRVPVSERALVQRINRKLTKDDEQLHATRPGTRAKFDLGRYYVRDFRRPNIVRMHVDIEDLARELEVLQPWEEMVPTEDV